MLYREFGNTGIKTSVLGFGSLRFAMTDVNGRSKVDREISTPMIQSAVDRGINFFDTGWNYCNYDSQHALGEALKPSRSKVFLSVKLPIYEIHDPDDFWKFLFGSLERLQTDYIDFYTIHAVIKEQWEKVLKFDILDKVAKAKSMGLIRHLSFSFHDYFDLFREMVDTELFSSCICQYNLLSRKHEECMKYADKKGLGVAVMSPAVGGNIADGGDEFLKRMKSTASSASEMAYRYVWGNPVVDTVLCGMSSMKMLDENISYAEKADSIPREEWEALDREAREIENMMEIFCTNCEYCKYACPIGVQPAASFKSYIRYQAWGLEEAAKKHFSQVGRNIVHYGKDPSLCTGCGKCSSKCPQKIDIPAELKRVVPVLRSLLKK